MPCGAPHLAWLTPHTVPQQQMYGTTIICVRKEDTVVSVGS